MMSNDIEYVDIDDFFEIDHTGTSNLEIDYSVTTYDFDYEYVFVPYYEYE
jgi:hypothetical protein